MWCLSPGFGGRRQTGVKFGNNMKVEALSFLYNPHWWQSHPYLSILVYTLSYNGCPNTYGNTCEHIDTVNNNETFSG